jgi:hypothetical protein
LQKKGISESRDSDQFLGVVDFFSIKAIGAWQKPKYGSITKGQSVDTKLQHDSANRLGFLCDRNKMSLSSYLQQQKTI